MSDNHVDVLGSLDFISDTILRTCGASCPKLDI
jgi:hypothetical protein